MHKGLLAIGQLVHYLAWPFWFVYFRLSTPRSKVVLEVDDEVLLIKNWLSQGEWSLPGGGAHRKEQIEVAAARELYEETSVKIQPDELEFLAYKEVNENKIKVRTNYFKCRLNDKPKIKLRKTEVAEYIWVKKSDIKNLKLSNQTRIGLKLTKAF